MKHAIWLLLGVLCSAMLLFAGDKATPLSGTICNSACVVHPSGVPACDPECTDKSGSAVIVCDNGHVKQIVNQEIAMPHMGEHVKAMVIPTAEQREETIRIRELYNQAP